MKYKEFFKELEKHEIVLSSQQQNQFKIYQKFLIEENKKINLTSIIEEEEIIDKHFYDSSLVLFYTKLKGTLVDIGTGAGFPGVVLKIINPNIKLVLVEPIKKRCLFLEKLIIELGLKDVEIVNERGEDYSLKNRGKFDFVTARAVSSLNILIEVSGALVKKDGYFLCLRGKDGLVDIKNASKALKIMGFSVQKIVETTLYDGSARVISLFKKDKETPKSFPRKYNIIKKNPL